MMHSKLVEDGIDKESLPPKKIIGNKDPAFIMKRRKELETYLQTIYRFFEKNLPQTLAEFLDFPTYDIHYLLQGLASEFHDNDLRPVFGSSSSGLNWSPLQLYAVSERLKTPCPPLNTDEKKHDFTNVVDVCCNTPSLAVTGSTEVLGSSQLVPNKLPIDFLAFKSLTRLELRGLELGLETVTSLGILRSTLQILRASECNLASISQLLLCDVTHAEVDLMDLIRNTGHSWPQLLTLDLSRNNLTNIDKSIRLAPSLTELNLSNNSIEEITNMTGLPHLRTIDLSQNSIKDIESLHTKIGQILTLDLSNNNIRNLHGMSKLYSVTNLDVSNNKLRTLADVTTVTSLPCVEKLTLSPNKVNNEVDYRLKVLEGYGGRCGEVTLDSQETSQAEMDKVSVLMALRVSREGKPPTSLFGNLPSSQQDL